MKKKNKVYDDEKRDLENKVNKLIRSLKKYSIKSYKQFLKIKLNEPHDLCPEKLDDGSLRYNLYTHPIVKKCYGQMSVTFKDGLLVDIQPENYLDEGYRTEFIVYKDVFIPNTPRDKFKVDYYSTLNK